MTARANPEIGRNDPCSCGSGDKHKHCCLVKDDALRLLLRLAKRRFRLIPIRAQEKFPPLLKEWQKHASCDPDQILNWYENHKNCNWAPATGSAAGYFIVDADGETGRNTVGECGKLYGDVWFKTT